MPAGWTDEQIVVLLGDVKLDLRNRPPGEGATLRVFHLVGDVRLRVSAGTCVTTSGTTLLGDHRVDVEAGEGPGFEVRAWGSSATLRSTNTPPCPAVDWASNRHPPVVRVWRPILALPATRLSPSRIGNDGGVASGTSSYDAAGGSLRAGGSK